MPVIPQTPYLAMCWPLLVNRVTENRDCNHCGSAAASGITCSMESTIPSSFLTCVFRPDRLFCDMPAESLKAFDDIKSLASYPRGTVLFSEGRPVRGIYILCDGRAKISICSEIEKRLTLRIAGPEIGRASCRE